MENVIFANGFEQHIEGLKICPSKTAATSQSNPDFLNLSPEIMGQIIRYQISYTAWTTLEKIFSASSKARVMQLRLEFQATQKGSLSMMEYILK